MSPKCPTGCREELLGKIDGMIPKSTIWKGILFFFMAWGIGATIYANGVSERKQGIQQNTAIAIQNREHIAVITRDLDYLKVTQTDANRKLDEMLRYTRRRDATDKEHP